MRILDLFCGAGGAAMGYHRAFPDAEIVGVDIVPQPRYPFTFHQGDAMTWPFDGYDLIHASPPCQAFSTMKVMHNAREHGDLLTPTRERLITAGIPYVIENVVGAPMDAGPPSLFASGGVMLCGSMFGLSNGIYELRRHRLFETSTPVPQPRCNHRLPVVGFYGDHARTPQRTVDGHRDRGGDITGTEQKLALVHDLLGIDWMKWHEANQAIPPAYTEWVGHRIMSVDSDDSTTQGTVGIADIAIGGIGQQVGDVLCEVASGAVGCDGESERVGHLPHNDEPAQEVKDFVGGAA